MKKNKNNLWKSKKLKKLPENSPKWPENIQNDFQNANFEKKSKLSKTSENHETNQKFTQKYKLF